MPSGACIVVANHTNLLDSPLLAISLGRKAYLMAKEELFDNAFIGFFTRQFGGFPVGKGRLDRRAGKMALEHLAQGHILIIFPEGKRSIDGKLGPAYGGAASLAMRTGLPVIPVGIAGTSKLVGKTWFFRHPRIKLSIGNPFTLRCGDDKLTRGHFKEATEQIMKHIAAELPEDYRGRYKAHD